MTTILSISIPDNLRGPLDAEAARQRRSRSFVVSEAVREYVARRTVHTFEGARDRTLLDGLALTPEGRVHLAESLASELAGLRKPSKPFVLGFKSQTEYDKWRDNGRPVPK